MLFQLSRSRKTHSKKFNFGRIFNVFRGSDQVGSLSNIILTVNSILALAPFVLLIIASFTDEDVAMNKGFSYFPSKWSLAAFNYIGQQWKMIGRAYLMTILVTAIGTVLSVVFTAMLAYMLSQKGLPGRKILNFYVVFTMLFNGGLVPTYIMYVRTFHIKNTV